MRSLLYSNQQVDRGPQVVEDIVSIGAGKCSLYRLAFGNLPVSSRLQTSLAGMRAQTGLFDLSPSDLIAA